MNGLEKLIENLKTLRAEAADISQRAAQVGFYINQMTLEMELAIKDLKRREEGDQ
jgi:NTP pyrophosphatase (non-canonical NTP hydrolase)